MRYNALANVKVVDLTHRIAGPYATKLLAQLGAEVIKVEPPGGEPGRRLTITAAPPAPEQDRSPLFAYLNTDKSGITLNLKDERGRALLKRLLADADLLVENFSPATMPRLGLAPSSLLAEFPRLSIVSISNFGQDGPDRDAPQTDLTLFARGGWTYAIGEPGREPLTPPGALAQYVGALFAAIGALQVLFARDLAGIGGQHADVSLLEATVATMIYDTVAFQYSGIARKRAGKRFAVGPFMLATLKCRDGYIGVHCVSDPQFAALCNLIGQPELVRDERFKTALARYVNNDALLEIVESGLAHHGVDFLYHEGQRRGLPMARIPTAAQVLEWEQLAARKYFETIEDPVLGRVRVPGAPLRLGSHRAAPSRPAPAPGQHNREILVGRLGLSDRELREFSSAGVI